MVEAVTVIATMYLGPVGGPLYCSTPANPLSFTTQQPIKWIALPVEDYQSGAVACGDLHYLKFADGSTLMARALDAGPFAMYCVKQPDGSCPSIGVDVPGYFWPVNGTSATVEMYNIGRWARERGMYAAH